jgi:hypothetical protein
MFRLNLLLILLNITCCFYATAVLNASAKKHAQLARIWKTLPRKTPPAEIANGAETQLME